MPAGPAARVTADTLAHMSAEIVGTPVKEKDRPAVADLLNALAADMKAMYAANVGDAEPAVTYDAAEAES
jgi:hypothetical protein